MKGTLLPLAALLLVACPRAEAPPAAPAATAEDLTGEDCTLETPLVPGVPGSPGHLIPSKLNPNGASELAALMRVMQADLAAAGRAIVAGEAPPPLYARHRKMRCAWPTVPADRTPAYDALARAYLARVRDLDARKGDLAAAHGAVLDACLACHRTSCEGPIPAIEALRLPAPSP